MRLRFVVAYDGTEFVGWQRQSRGRSVQAELEQALARVTGASPRVTGAGRTDAGVHAVGQVGHFDTDWPRGVDTLERAWNAVLPADVSVSWLAAAPMSFHARHDAVTRTYRYRVSTDSSVRPFLGRTWITSTRGLDIAAMVEGAGRLVGQHDFGAFGHPMSADGSTVRRLDAVLLRTGPDLVTLEFVGESFLRHQVRRMVGLLMDIGSGRQPVDAVQCVLARTAGAPVARRAPARGLILWAVSYPPDEMPWGYLRREGASSEDLYA